MNRRHVLFAVLVLLLALATPALNPASASKPVLVVYVCSDGIDNDGSGDTDYPADEACFSAEQDIERDTPVTGPCADGYDNDRDGRLDYPADPGCRSPFDEDERVPGRYNPFYRY